MLIITGEHAEGKTTALVAVCLAAEPFTPQQRIQRAYTL